MITFVSQQDTACRKTLLPNGIRVVTQYMPSVRSVALGVWVWSGSRFEPPHRHGIAHFLEHMVFKGTTRRTPYQIAQSIESLGGHLNAFTGRELNCYFARVLDDHLPIAIDVLGDILQNARFDPQDIEKEKEVVLDEIRGLEDTPEDLVNELFTALVWDSHPLGRSILGTVEAVSSFTGEDLQAHLRDRYQARHIYVIAAGHVDHDRLAQLVLDQYQFSGPAVNGDDAPPPAPVQRRHIQSKDISQVYLCFGGLSIPFSDARKYTMFILNTILGGGMTSRLFQKIREDAGLAYSIYSDVDFCRDSGLFCISAGTDAEDVPRVLDMIQKECRTVRETPLGDDEFRDAKSQLIGGLCLSLEGSTNVMNRLARLEMYLDGYVSPEETIAGINRVTVREVMDLANEILAPERLSLALMGPVSPEEL